jgi:rhamnogalacturonan endolyase
MRSTVPVWFTGALAAGLLAACGGGDTASSSTSASAPRLLATGASASADIAGSFGVSEAAGYLSVDSGAGLVFKVKQSNGDITSIKYKGGPELQSQTKGSHIASGLGAAVSYTVSGGVAKITLTTATLVHYLLVRANDNTIYMGTYVTAEPSVGELRWITRLKGSVFTQVPVESNNAGSDRDVESTDVRGYPDGTTTSKYYGNQRAIDLSVRGVRGDGVGAFMVYGSREGSSGGPFHRDIQNQSGGDAELYNYMNSGHAQTEAWRMGFQGPYALIFTDGATPAIPDMGWMESQNLSGWVPASQRGKVSGRGLLGFDLAHKFTVAFKNDTAQYWAVAKAPNGNFTTPPMKPGSYTMTVFKDELELYTETVDVGSGATTLPQRTLGADPDKAPAIWRIGTWDGTPLEFMNGTSFNVRHPSDIRNKPWGPVDYTIGDPVDAFPPAQWKVAANSPTRVSFNLTPAQLGQHTIRIGITTATAGGRPQITVNGWSSSAPAASSQPSSRTLTVGSYRGNNKMYTYNVPASAFVAGTNTLTINVASGSSGSSFTGPGYAYDALDML